MGQPSDTTLFKSEDVRLMANTAGELVLNVRCDRMGEFHVEFALNEEERKAWEAPGATFLIELIDKVRAQFPEFAKRGRYC